MQLEIAAPLPWPPTVDTLSDDMVLVRLDEAEAQGFAGLWLTSEGHGAASPSLHLAAAWLAARTERATLGVRASLPATLHPLRLAEELATLDLMSGGRLAWAAAPETREPDAASALAEQVAVVEKAWAGDRFSHAGARWQIPELQCLPAPPRPGGPPLWIAADDGPDDAATAWAARESRPPWCDETLPAAGVVRVLAAASGTDARVVRWVHVAADRARARDAARAAGLDPERDGAIVGDPAGCCDAIADLGQRLGLDTLVCRLDLPSLSDDAVVAAQRLLADAVLPRLG